MLLKEFQQLKIGDLIANKKSKRIYKVIDINRTTWQLRVTARGIWSTFSNYEIVKEDYLIKQLEKVANGVKLTISNFEIQDNKSIVITLIPTK